ncbi:MAG: hypothetical protein WBP48_13740, partial [Microbacterium sp.]
MRTAFGVEHATSSIDDALRRHGVPEQFVGAVRGALEEFVGAGKTTAATDGAIAFALAAGIPAVAFSDEAEHENRLYEAASTAVLGAELRRSLLTTNELAELLCVQPSHVRRLVGRGDLMTAGQIDGQSLYPSWQVVEGAVVPGLRAVLAEFPDDYHPLDIQWVMTEPAEALRGRTPVEWLTTGG